MTDQPQSPQESEPVAMRFEATIHAVEAGEMDLARVAELDVDRIPDPEDSVRLLVSLDECARLVQEGFEVRLQRAVPIRPLDPRLVADDDELRAWFDERVRATGRTESS